MHKIGQYERRVFFFHEEVRGIKWVVKISDHTYDNGLLFSATYSTFQNDITHQEMAQVNLYIKTKSRAMFVIKVCKSKDDLGVGTSLLKFVEKYSLGKGIKELYGDIYSGDKDHFDKLKHFYEKNEYKWELYQPPPEIIVGRVSKVL